jgi:hypothetical protein
VSKQIGASYCCLRTTCESLTQGQGRFRVSGICRTALALPNLSTNLIAELILPYVGVGDRATWNSLCATNEEPHEAGRQLIPPWPEKGSIQVGSIVTCFALSPNGTHVAWGCQSHFLHLWDATGKHTRLEGHSARITLLLSHRMVDIWFLLRGIIRFDFGILLQLQIMPTPTPLLLLQKNKSILHSAAVDT